MFGILIVMMHINNRGLGAIDDDAERVREALANGDFRRLREGVGMGLPMLARSCDVSPGNLSRYERGLANPAGTTLRRLVVAWRELERMARTRAVSS